MLEISRQLDLAEKSFSAKCRSAFSIEDFERNPAVMLDVFGGVYSRHTTPADYALDAIALGENSVG